MTDDGTKAHPANRVLLTSEVATLLGVNPLTVQGMARAGSLPASKLGPSSWRYWKPLVVAQIDPQATPRSEDPDEPDFATVRDVARLLRISAPTLILRIKDGSIPAVAVARKYRLYWPRIRSILESGQDFTPRSSDA